MNNTTTERHSKRIHLATLFFYHVRKHMALNMLLVSAFLFLLFCTYLGFLDANGFNHLNLLDFEAGKVADRDVVAGRELTLVDETATAIRRDASSRLVLPVFRYDRSVSESMISDIIEFQDYTLKAFSRAANLEQFILEVEHQYPGKFDTKLLGTLYRTVNPQEVLSATVSVFRQIAAEGIAAFPDAGLERFSPSFVEVYRWKNDRQERIEVPRESLLTENTLERWISASLMQLKTPASIAPTVSAFIKPFITSNLVYQTEESELKLENVLKQVPPVTTEIRKGQKIIRRGFIVSEDNFRMLEMAATSGGYFDYRLFAGTILFLFSILVTAWYVFASNSAGKTLELKSVILITISFCLLYIITLVFSRMQSFSLPLDLSVIIPAAMLMMLITVLVNQQVAIISSFIFSFGVLCASGFSLPPSLFTLFSGIAGVSVMKISGKRIDLIKSACVLAVLNPLAMIVLVVVFPAGNHDRATLLFMSAVNGFMSGILVLGFLPILESALNTSTSFRLMEFSDLNSPLMKKLLLSVSGTYNHSIMVATLAESACRAIGADPLLARVGAYYHDIGKMDQGEYFVENQIDHNKHHDINPRLSATVIRSHVKQGVEKARQMRLPKEVVDIIAEHHGNSLISYFYCEAKKISDDVDPDDFMYPGTPPTTKESAVVMLADIVEAACRTLEKPSISRLEKFINELIEKKIETNQLDNSDLTFREVGIIRRTFLNILAGYYHSRIEYPNKKEIDDTKSSLSEFVQRGKK